MKASLVQRVLPSEDLDTLGARYAVIATASLGWLQRRLGDGVSVRAVASATGTGSRTLVGGSLLLNRSHEFMFISNDSKYRRGRYRGSVETYPLTASGDAPPINVIAGSHTQLSEVEGIAVDLSGRVYVANTDTTTVVGFAPKATGDAGPVVIIGGSNTGLVQPLGIAVDGSDNLYVANCGQCGTG